MPEVAGVGGVCALPPSCSGAEKLETNWSALSSRGAAVGGNEDPAGQAGDHAVNAFVVGVGAGRCCKQRFERATLEVLPDLDDCAGMFRSYLDRFSGVSDSSNVCPFIVMVTWTSAGFAGVRERANGVQRRRS